MKSIRRLYFYLVAFIGIIVALNAGVIPLLRSIVDRTVGGGANELAGGLASIIVGIPVFLIHWLWAQRASAREEEEKTASLRAVFLYAILLATLIPVVQNLLSFIDRSLVQVTGLGVERAFRAFGEQTLADNLIAIGMNIIVAAYFLNILRGEWATLTDKENFSDVRRLYRYIWMLYGLLMTVFGAQQILQFLFYIPGNVLGEMGREIVINGMALLLIGTPVWVYTWRVIQDSLSDPAEMGSALRLGILYILALGGVVTVITAAWNVMDILLMRLLGQSSTFNELIRDIGGPLSIGVPLGMVWAYYGYWLNRHIEATGDKVRESGMKRLYYYILSFIGLVVAFVGVTMIFSFIIDALADSFFFMSDAHRSSLANSIASLIVGLPLWLMTWRPMQAEALAEGGMGNHARRSVIRKFYLYLVLFASVIGGMATAVRLVYQLINTLLGGSGGGDFVNTLLNLAQLLFLFGVVLVYHLRVLRADGAASTTDSGEEKQGIFSVLVVDSGDGLVDSVRTALVKYGSKAQVAVKTPDENIQGDYQVIVMSGKSAMDAPEWIRSFGGNRLFIQKDAQSLLWMEDTKQAVESVQMIAEDQIIHKQKPGRSPWMIVVYIFAALFGLELLFILLSLGFELLR